MSYLNDRQTSRLWAKIKAYVTNAIGGITSVSFVIVQTLPATGAAGAIYLVPNSGSSPNIYDEYIYVANAWEKIGTTEIDLSGYVQTSRKINNKALSADITLSASDVGALSTSGDGKSVTVTFTRASTRTNIASGNTLATTLGRISRWFADLGTMAFKSSVEKTDLETSVQTSLGKADTALQSYTETDPTVPSWAKQSTKPSYTASEVGAVPTSRTVNGKALSANISLSASDVGALPSSTQIPDSTSDLTNDSGFLTLATLPIYDGTVV